MDRDEAMKLLKGGPDGVAEWNRRRRAREPIHELNDADLHGVEVSGADLSGIYLKGADLHGADLSGANLTHSKLGSAQLAGASLRDANAQNAYLEHADLRSADLRGAKLVKANLTRADLAQANLCGVDLSRAYAHEANLSDAKLPGATLHGASLTGTDLSGADLATANLANVRLIGANLSSAWLENANLSAAWLVDANLSGVWLGGANLAGAELQGADLSGAGCSLTIFGGGTDLCSVRNLETVEFRGPCSVGQDVVAASKGRIPESFLRGCGFQPWEILSTRLYDSGLSTRDVEDLLYDIFKLRTQPARCIGGVFISYAHADTKLVDKLYDRLKEEKITVWLDRHDLVAGPLQRQVVRGIRMMDVVVLVLSEASVHSDWVDDEVRAARVKEREEKRDVLCPVALDDAWKKKLGTGRSLDDMEEADADWMHLAKKNVLDFSKWKTKAFEPQFKKLLKGLKIYYTPEKARDEGTEGRRDAGATRKDEG